METRAPLPRPIPTPEGLNAEFYAHCAAGKLAIQRCSDCEAWRHLPRYMCPECGSEKWTWQNVSGDARLHSWTVTHRAMHPAFANDVPYVVGVVELAEGPRLVAPIRNVRAEDLTLDQPLRLAFERLSDEIALPVFHPA